MELTAAEAEKDTLKHAIAYMIDQSHNTKPKLEAMIQTVEEIQTAQAKALLVDRKRLRKAQDADDVSGAERCLVEAYRTDVEPLLKSVREEMGASLSPVEAHRASGYLEKAAKKRMGTVSGAGLGVNS